MKQPLQNAATVEQRHPGMTAVAGPYDVNHADESIAQKHQTYLDNSFRDQQRKCQHAKIVMHGKKAWIIRKLPLILDSDSKADTFTSRLGIRAGRGGSA